ncbi:MAG: hypothetical protein KDK91_17715 [Gammaproteobacteria bacterium]|nr:hypothetical protein [Gammaproteobacteria bacterium]
MTVVSVLIPEPAGARAEPPSGAAQHADENAAHEAQRGGHQRPGHHRRGRPEVIDIAQADFRCGTYIIDKPGYYRLVEDISFNPNSIATMTEAMASGEMPMDVAQSLGLSLPIDAYQASRPMPTQFVRDPVDFQPGGPMDARYDPSGFGLGFFAAIVITADGVVLDLNGHTIEQSAEHALLQRFFSVIELAEQPFKPGQGPADFGAAMASARNVVIKNGTIGRSAHHGIHGNDNVNVRIHNVDFVDFEVAAVALNGVRGLLIERSSARNRKDVPVLGTFSSAQFIKPYVEYLHRVGSTTRLDVNGVSLGVDDIRSGLRASVNAVYEDIIANPHMVSGRAQIDPVTHPEAFALFHNQHGVIDGNAYGYLVNRSGVAVDGFPSRPDGISSFAARNIVLTRVSVEDHVGAINEVVALAQGGKPVIDPVGAVFQVRNRHPLSGTPVTISSLTESEALYLGNPVANAQAFVAKAHLAGEFAGTPLDMSRLNITADVLRWVEAEPGFETLESLVGGDGQGYLCNGDSMFHVNKGVIAFKMDAARNVLLHRTHAGQVHNLGAAGSSDCGDYSQARSHPAATLPGYGGARARGYTFAGSENVLLVRAGVGELSAQSGDALGVDVLTDARDVALDRVELGSISAGFDAVEDYVAPNELPRAVGVHVSAEARQVRIKRTCAEILAGLGGELVIDDESDSARLRRICD